MNALLFFMLSLPPAPPLQAAEPLVDRGEVKAGAILAHTFALKNIGTSAITIIDVEAGCGCMRPRASSRMIQPGASAEVKVDVNTISQPTGANAWKITVRYQTDEGGGPTSHELELMQKARIVREISVDPVALYLSVEKEATHTITITDRRAKPLTISEARSSSKHLKARLTAAGVNTKGERIQQVHVTVPDDCPPGFHSEVVQLIIDDPAYPELQIPVTISRRVPGEISAVPEHITLRLADGQKAASGLLRLRDPEDRAVVIDKMEADHPALRTKWAAGPGSMATLRIGVEFGGERSSGIGSVRVYVKEPKPQTLVIPVIWQVP